MIVKNFVLKCNRGFEMKRMILSIKKPSKPQSIYETLKTIKAQKYLVCLCQNT